MSLTKGTIQFILVLTIIMTFLYASIKLQIQQLAELKEEETAKKEFIIKCQSSFDIGTCRLYKEKIFDE